MTSLGGLLHFEKDFEMKRYKYSQLFEFTWPVWDISSGLAKEGGYTVVFSVLEVAQD